MQKNISSAMFLPRIDFDQELEYAVLGIILLEPESFGKVFGVLIPECFFLEETQAVFEAITEVYKSGSGIDFLTVARFFYNKSQTSINNIPVGYCLALFAKDVCTSAHLEDWCIMLRELAVKRLAITTTTSGLDRSEDVLDIAEMIKNKMEELITINSRDDWEDGSQVAMKLLQHMEDMVHGKSKMVTTSILEMDRMNGGFRPGQLIILAARPGVGKTAFLGRMAVAAAKDGLKVGVINLEMDSKDVFARMVCFAHDIEFSQLDRNNFFNQSEYEHALKSITENSKLPIYFSDNVRVSIQDIRAKAEMLKRKHGIDILFIDYLQLVVPETNKQGIREQEVAKISIGTKRLARELEIPIVMLAQLNRQADQEEPQLKHLRESGSLEQDSDIVMMLHRVSESEDQTERNSAFLYVRKWRNGAEMKIPLRFEGARMKFMEMSEISFQFKDNPNTSSIANAGRNILDEPQPF